MPPLLAPKVGQGVREDAKGLGPTLVQEVGPQDVHSEAAGNVCYKVLAPVVVQAPLLVLFICVAPLGLAGMQATKDAMPIVNVALLLVSAARGPLGPRYDGTEDELRLRVVIAVGVVSA